MGEFVLARERFGECVPKFTSAWEKGAFAPLRPCAGRLNHATFWVWFIQGHLRVARPESAKGVVGRSHALRGLRACHPRLNHATFCNYLQTQGEQWLYENAVFE